MKDHLRAGDPKCPVCQGSGWTCEEHPDRPWEHDDCGGAGGPCRSCNPKGAAPWVYVGAAVDEPVTVPTEAANDEMPIVGCHACGWRGTWREVKRNCVCPQCGALVGELVGTPLVDPPP